MNDLAIILYSHSDVSFMWFPFVSEQEEYFSNDCFKYFFVNDTSEWSFNYKTTINELNFNDYKIIYYNDRDSYATRLLTSLKEVKEDFVLLSHEDMMLHSNCNQDMMSYYLQIMKHNEQFAYLKLLRGGISQSQPLKISEGLFYLQDDEQYRFVIQPCIWKKSVLISILENFKDSTIYQLEENASKYMIENKIQALFAYNEDDKKRGLYHWENKHYPFIATALIKGKWNDTEYPTEIDNLKRAYGLK